MWAGLRQQYIDRFIHPDESGVLHNSMTGFYRLTPGNARQIGQREYANQAVHPEAVDRLKADPSYKPENLREYLKRPDHRVAEVHTRN